MLLWSIFIIFILFLLALDLGVFNRENHVPSTREALRWTSLWAAVGLSFAFVVYYLYSHHWGDRDMSGSEAVMKYLSGYLVELSLSMDNVFVMALIFKYFRIPGQFQHRVLFWGILGALIFRAMMIFCRSMAAGTVPVDDVPFGAILIYSAWKMLSSDEEIDPNRNPIIRYAKKTISVTNTIENERFLCVGAIFWLPPPLFVALLMIETTDVLFAFDSIPAILAITTDPFLVFSSNVFAILGLRSLYFVLASMMDRFEYLKYSLALILFFVAAKMLLHEFWHPAEWLNLVVIFVLLTGGVLVSLYQTRKEEKLEQQKR